MLNPTWGAVGQDTRPADTEAPGELGILPHVGIWIVGYDNTYSMIDGSVQCGAVVLGGFLGRAKDNHKAIFALVDSARSHIPSRS